MAMDCAPPLSRGDVIAEFERRGDGVDRLGALADAAYRDAAVVEDAARDALVDVGALDLVEAHLKGAALAEAGLLHDPHIGDVGLGGPALAPGLHGRLPRHGRHDG